MDVIFTKQLLFSALGVDFQVLPNSKKVILESLVRQDDEVLKNFLIKEKEFLRLLNFDEDVIYVFKWLFDSLLIIFYSKKTDQIYTIGPVLTSPFSDGKALEQLRRVGIGKDYEGKLLNCGALLPVVKESIMSKISLLLYRKAVGVEKNPTFQTVNVFSSALPSSEIRQGSAVSMRRVEQRYEMSTAVTEAVKQGNFSLATSLMLSYGSREDFSVRNSSPLRNFQNYCIVLNTQLRYAMESVGIHPYVLDDVSNDLGVKIEKLNTTEKAKEFIIEIIRRYCDLARENEHGNAKPLIKLTVAFVKENLASDITLKDVAKKLNVNANYLSALFKKEKGLGFTDFINVERIKQAKAFLTYTAMQIQQIAELVGYKSANYFTEIFKKFEKVSPKKYRENLDAKKI